MNGEDLNLIQAILYLHRGKLDKQIFLDSAIGETFYDERLDRERTSEKRELLNALEKYQKNPDSENMVRLVSELADMYVKELKAHIIYKDENMYNIISGERLNLQMKLLGLQIPIGMDALEDIAQIKYVSRAKNLIENETPKDHNLENKLIAQYLNSN